MHHSAWLVLSPNLELFLHRHFSYTYITSCFRCTMPSHRAGLRHKRTFRNWLCPVTSLMLQVTIHNLAAPPAQLRAVQNVSSCSLLSRKPVTIQVGGMIVVPNCAGAARRCKCNSNVNVTCHSVLCEGGWW